MYILINIVTGPLLLFMKIQELCFEIENFIFAIPGKNNSTQVSLVRAFSITFLKSWSENPASTKGKFDDCVQPLYCFLA